MELARFSLLNYHFDKVSMDLRNLSAKSSFNIKFDPSGVFDKDKSQYWLTFKFTAKEDVTGREIVSVNCVALYLFKGVNSIEEIPAFFYNNAIAILFPYIRAFVSTVTLQANIKPILLPTLNLSDLQDRLKENTRSM